jgi:hypothetical protein
MTSNQCEKHPLLREASMCRYFFHVRRGQVTILDHIGAELADLDEATSEAMRRGREIAAKDAAEGIASDGAAIVVANKHWSQILEVPLEGDDA